MINRYDRERKKLKDKNDYDTGRTDIARPSTRALTSPLSAVTKINKKTKRIIRNMLNSEIKNKLLPRKLNIVKMAGSPRKINLKYFFTPT
jgi:hypothetical protein